MIPFSNSGGPLLMTWTFQVWGAILYLNSPTWCWYVLIWFCRKHMLKLHIPANLPLMFDQQSYTLHSFQILSAFHWLHFQLAACLDPNPIYEIHWNPAAPFRPTPSSTKHQAFAPSSAIQLVFKFRLIKVEFSLRPSAKAWQEKFDQTLGHLIPPFLLENFSRTKGWGMDGFGMQYVSFSIKFAHICSLTALERYLPKKNLNPSPSQSDHHKTTSEESQCIYRLATLRSTKIHYAMDSFLSSWTFHWLHFQVAVSWSFLYAPSLPTILTKHQAFAPSALIWFCCKSRFFRVEFSLRPSAKAWQEKSGPWVQLLNLIKLWVLSVLPWQSLQPRDGG